MAKKIKIKNAEIVDSPKWGDVPHAAQAKELQDAGNKAAIDEMYLYVGDYDKRSTYKFPHHYIESDGVMAVHRDGLLAAEEMLKKGNIPNKKAAARHLLGHMRKHDIEPSDELVEMAKGIYGHDEEDLMPIVDEDDLNQKSDEEQKAKKPKQDNPSDEGAEQGDSEEDKSRGKKKPAKDEKDPAESDDDGEDQGDSMKGKKKPEKTDDGSNADDYELNSKKPEDDDEEDADGDEKSKKGKKKPEVEAEDVDDEGDDGDGAGEKGKKVAAADDGTSVTDDDKPQGKSLFSSHTDALKAKKCPFSYDDTTDTFKMLYGMQAVSAKADCEGDEIQDAIKAAFGTKAGSNPDFRPTDEELEKINKLSNRPLKRDEVKVFYITGADTKVDRHAQHFAIKALQTLSDTAPDSPWIKDHNYFNSDGVVGKFFDGKVSKGKDGTGRLLLKAYVLDTPENKSFIDGVESGINNKFSVGLRMKRNQLKCDVCKCAMYDMNGQCRHYAGMELPDNKGMVTATIEDALELIEGSRVTVPAQPGAGVKSLSATVKSLEHELQASKSADGFSAAGIVAQVMGLSEEQVNQLLKSESSEQQEPTEVQNQGSEEVPTISSEVKQAGDSTVDEQTKQAFDAAVGSMQKAVSDLSEVVKSLTESVTKQSEIVDKLLANKETEAQEQKAKEELLEKKVNETRECFTLLIGLHKDLASKCGQVIGKSMEDLKRDILQARELVKSVNQMNEEEKKTKAAKGGDGFYNGVVDELAHPTK